MRLSHPRRGDHQRTLRAMLTLQGGTVVDRTLVVFVAAFTGLVQRG